MQEKILYSELYSNTVVNTSTIIFGHLESLRTNLPKVEALFVMAFTEYLFDYVKFQILYQKAYGTLNFLSAHYLHLKMFRLCMHQYKYFETNFL